MNIGKAIKQLRKKQSLSQAQLAERTGITQTALSQIENGSRRPNNETFKKLTDYFQVPEILIYLLATEDTDVAENKQEMFRAIFPNVKNLLLSVFE